MYQYLYYFSSNFPYPMTSHIQAGDVLEPNFYSFLKFKQSTYVYMYIRMYVHASVNIIF